MFDYFKQCLQDFNVFMFLAIVIVNTALSKANSTKLLKEQSQELYNEIEEIKDEIRECRK
jgi:hypothetical protein